MSSLAVIEGVINRLPPDQRAALQEAFKEVVTSIRFGRPLTGRKSENFAAAFYEGATPSVANTEFSIAHNFGRAPYLAWGVLDLQAEGCRTVPLRVTKVADAKRLYLSSSEADAPILLYVEG